MATTLLWHAPGGSCELAAVQNKTDAHLQSCDANPLARNFPLALARCHPTPANFSVSNCSHQPDLISLSPPFRLAAPMRGTVSVLLLSPLSLPMCSDAFCELPPQEPSFLPNCFELVGSVSSRPAGHSGPNSVPLTACPSCSADRAPARSSPSIPVEDQRQGQPTCSLTCPQRCESVCVHSRACCPNDELLDTSSAVQERSRMQANARVKQGGVEEGGTQDRRQRHSPTEFYYLRHLRSVAMAAYGATHGHATASSLHRVGAL